MSCKVLGSPSNLVSFRDIYEALLWPSFISFTVTANAPLHSNCQCTTSQ